MDTLKTAIWETESFRMTLFPRVIIPENLSLWKELLNEEPEIRNQTPRNGFTHEEGPYESGRLSIDVQPIKTDIMFLPQDSNSDGFVCGNYTEAMNVFKKILKKVSSIDLIPSSSRLAFGATLLFPVKSREEGYKILSEYLSLQLDGINSSDFFYQINRPKEIALNRANIKINRLSQWSVIESISFVAMSPNESHPLPKRNFAVRLLTDINTPIPDVVIDYPTKSVPDCFNTLIAFSQELSESGDIK